MRVLKGKRITLGVTGSIAAYKAVGLASALHQAGAIVDVAMTPDAQRRLLGTALAPGLRTAMDGLFQRAARLSRIELEPPTQAIGRNTVAALRSGWVYGYVGLVEGLVARIKAQLGADTLVIATGGLADYVLSETSVVDVHDPMLTLKGLRLYYDRNVRNTWQSP